MLLIPGRIALFLSNVTRPIRREFPRLGFAFFGRCEMVMLLILCMLLDFVIG
jgi:hypothetical protein